MTCMFELVQFASIRRTWVRGMVNNRHAKLCVIALMFAFLTPTRAESGDHWIGETIKAGYENLLLAETADYAVIGQLAASPPTCVARVVRRVARPAPLSILRQLDFAVRPRRIGDRRAPCHIHRCSIPCSGSVL